MQSHIIIIGECAEGHIAPVTFELIAFARILQQHTTPDAGIHLFLAGRHLADAASRLAQTEGADITLLETDAPKAAAGTVPIDLIFKNPPMDRIRRLNPVYVCAGHTPNGADIAPALAVALNAACVTGVERVVSDGQHLHFIRSVFNDRITTAILPTSRTAVLTVTPGIFKSEHTAKIDKTGTVSVLTLSIEKTCYTFHGFEKTDADTSALSHADVIVSAGNGVKRQEYLETIYQLSRLFPKSAVAGSRPVCDRKWLTYSQQVGVTGATVKPKLYIACGISGASQHTAGMRDSRFIVAINTDPHAAIFNIADVCIIEDLTIFIPRFIARAYAATETGE